MAAMLLAEVMGAGLLSARQLLEALSLPRERLEAVCSGDVALPTVHQRALALLVIERGAEYPDLVRRAHRLLGQTEAALRVEAGNTELHSLAPVYWR